jgi:hypothetical protein
MMYTLLQTYQLLFEEFLLGLKYRLLRFAMGLI